MINTRKLTKELITAGIQIEGVNDKGVVWGIGGEDISSRSDVSKIIAKHNPEAEIKLPPKNSAEAIAEIINATPQDDVWVAIKILAGIIDELRKK